MDVYEEIVVKIVSGQEAIIGPVAVEQAEHINHLKVDWEHHSVSIDGDKSNVIENLINAYKDLFGQISVEVSKQSAASLMSQLPANAVPDILK
jgi:hypothetical protein